MPRYVQYKISDGLICASTGVPGTDGPGTLPSSDPDYAYIRVTDVESSLHDSMPVYPDGGSQAWKMENGKMVSNPDIRPILSAFPISIDVSIGDTSPEIVFTRTIDGLIDSSYNEILYAPLQDSRLLKLTFLNGISSIFVSTQESKYQSISSNKNFILINPLTIHISTNTL